MRSSGNPGVGTPESTHIALLDLSFPLRLPSALGRVWDEVATDHRGPFAHLIDRIAAENPGDVDWWVSGPATRNEYLSPLFHNLVSVLFVRRLLASGSRVDHLVLASRAVAGVLGRALPGAGARTVSVARGALSTVLRGRLSICRSAAWFAVRQCMLRRWTPGRHKAAGRTRLIDVFVIPGSVETDRYYPGLWESLPTDCRAGVCFVPQVPITTTVTGTVT